jgi:hypothetical protein
MKNQRLCKPLGANEWSSEIHHRRCCQSGNTRSSCNYYWVPPMKFQGMSTQSLQKWHCRFIAWSSHLLTSHPSSAWRVKRRNHPDWDQLMLCVEELNRFTSAKSKEIWFKKRHALALPLPCIPDGYWEANIYEIVLQPTAAHIPWSPGSQRQNNRFPLIYFWMCSTLSAAKW